MFGQKSQLMHGVLADAYNLIKDGLKLEPPKFYSEFLEGYSVAPREVRPEFHREYFGYALGIAAILRSQTLFRRFNFIGLIKKVSFHSKWNATQKLKSYSLIYKIQSRNDYDCRAAQPVTVGLHSNKNPPVHSQLEFNQSISGKKESRRDALS